MRRWRLAIGVWVLALAAMIAAASHHWARSEAKTGILATSATVGHPLPDLVGQRLDGSVVSMRSYEGRPLWLNFFATWCPPCNVEMPEIERRYRLDSAKGLAVVAVDQQESPTLVRRFARALGLSFPVIIDGGSAARAFGISALPVSVFVDARGIIRLVRYGQLDSADMDQALATILHKVR